MQYPNPAPAGGQPAGGVDGEAPANSTTLAAAAPTPFGAVVPEQRQAPEGTTGQATAETTEGEAAALDTPDTESASVPAAESPAAFDNATSNGGAPATGPDGMTDDVADGSAGGSADEADDTAETGDSSGIAEAPADADAVRDTDSEPQSVDPIDDEATSGGAPGDPGGAPDDPATGPDTAEAGFASDDTATDGSTDRATDTVTDTSTNTVTDTAGDTAGDSATDPDTDADAGTPPVDVTVAAVHSGVDNTDDRTDIDQPAGDVNLVSDIDEVTGDSGPRHDQDSGVDAGDSTSTDAETDADDTSTGDAALSDSTTEVIDTPVYTAVTTTGDEPTVDQVAAFEAPTVADHTAADADQDDEDDVYEGDEDDSGVVVAEADSDDDDDDDSDDEDGEHAESSGDLIAAAAAAGAGAAAMRPGDLPESRIAIWDSGKAEDFRRRLRKAEARFVDDPNKALNRTAEVVTDAVNALAKALLKEQRKLDPRRQAKNADTEALRVALRQYKEFLERVLSL